MDSNKGVANTKRRKKWDLLICSNFKADLNKHSMAVERYKVLNLTGILRETLFFWH